MKVIAPALSLASPRLILRSLGPDDAAGPYLRWMNDYEVTKYLESRFRSYTQTDLSNYIVDMSSKPNTVLLGIFNKDSSGHIGNIKLVTTPEHCRAEIGLIVGEKSQWGKGYGTEAIDCLSHYGFSELKLHKLTAGCYSNNPGSQRAFEKAGFLVEGRRTEHYKFEDRWTDLVLLARFACSAKPDA